MVAKKNIRKFGFRLLVVVVVFVCIKLATDSKTYNDNWLGPKNTFYFVSALFFFLLTWEFNDWLIKRKITAPTDNDLDWKAGIEILGKTLILALPIFAIVYYLAIFEFNDFLEIETDNQWLQFRADFLRASLLALTTIIFNLYYFSDKVKKGLRGKVTSMEQELLSSKYKSLKSQISPHFLFNSLNTLTALMYDDRDLASDFVTRLSSSYRYILDNQEVDIVRLEKELNFLDSFIFMMEVRHKNSVHFEMDINIDSRVYYVPTLCLQMLVENALKHNYYSVEKPLYITINANEYGLQIQNTLRKRTDIAGSTQLGIENIKKRYSYYTNKQVVVTGKHELFTVELPLLEKDAKPLKNAQTLI